MRKKGQSLGHSGCGHFESESWFEKNICDCVTVTATLSFRTTSTEQPEHIVSAHWFNNEMGVQPRRRSTSDTICLNIRPVLHAAKPITAIEACFPTLYAAQIAESFH
ncbi:hypothetical protein AMATHDRAFT_88696 [Amanita thiersii Skay4041]|uniref:Uncharacterized protein n=1 Tax=Amanita thiersii Skay4041 TaxID=703135 RepID=A0A2A9NDA6_9AGAR|nr:hypothetical protein AMATHDRAFT_88696 [Amanita thiersii Skay4041]